MSNQEIIDKLLNGEMKLYQVDKEVSAKEATDIRRQFLEQKYDLDLSNISNYTLDMERASARNIENVKTGTVNTINVYDLLKYKTLVLTVDTVKKLEEVYA